MYKYTYIHTVIANSHTYIHIIFTVTPKIVQIFFVCVTNLMIYIYSVLAIIKTHFWTYEAKNLVFQWNIYENIKLKLVFKQSATYF